MLYNLHEDSIGLTNIQKENICTRNYNMFLLTCNTTLEKPSLLSFFLSMHPLFMKHNCTDFGKLSNFTYFHRHLLYKPPAWQQIKLPQQARDSETGSRLVIGTLLPDTFKDANRQDNLAIMGLVFGILGTIASSIPASHVLW